MSNRRFPRWVYGDGEEADPRFSLVNERTFLAWIRTSLALIAVAIALEALQLPIRASFRTGSSSVFIAIGLLASVYAWINWMRTERAIHRDKPLPAPVLSAVLGAGVVLATLLIAAGTYLR